MKIKSPLVSIVMPVYRAEYFIADVIENISGIRYPNFEAILVFDPSSDKGIEIAKGKLKKKRNWCMIVNKKHLGVSKSLNLGIKKSKGKYIAFFMTDMQVDPNCLRELVNFIEKSDKSLGAVVAKTYDYHQHDRIQAYSMYLMPQTGFLYIPEYGLKDNKKLNTPFEGYSGIDGAMFKKEVFKKAGMFDTDIEVGINDLDMMWRIWLAGFRVVRVPTAKVYHWSLKEGRATDKWEFSYARMINIFIQNYSLKYLLIYLPQFFIIYSLRSLITLLSGNPNPMKGWIRSIFWSVCYLPRALKKREILQNRV